jgi:SAM-dependent methyltransferase
MQFAAKVVRHLRRRFIDAPRGLGHPVPADTFDRDYAAGRWDLLFSQAELPRNEALAELILTANPRPVVLDVGCGSGRLAQLLAARAPVRYQGIDLSAEGLRRARQLALAGCEFAVGDFETWRPSTSATFDAIVFNESIGYARDPRATLEAFASHLTPAGRVFVSYFRSGNYVALWRRVFTRFASVSERLISNPTGQAWDIRVLRPIAQ